MNLKTTDPQIYGLIEQEKRRQYDVLRLIPSENYTSQAVLEATGSILTNKYSEGYPKRRYYEGQDVIDTIELLTRKRAMDLFGAEHANAQPYSGSPANLAVYMAFANPGDPIMGMALPHGGHLTHGHTVSITGRFFDAHQYSVSREKELIDFDQVREIALKTRPKILFAGATAYPRTIDFAAFASIAKEVGAIFVSDIAHIAGLIAGGAHPSPIPHADVVTTTTHKTLRGPRGGLIMCREIHRKNINRAVFPGLQGGPHNHVTAAIGVALKEASSDEFKEYAHQIVKNAKAMAEKFLELGYRLVTGGTDNHLLLIDLTNKGVFGRKAAKSLNRAGIVCNANTIPFDPRKPFDPSGVRLGTPAVTSRGMKETEMVRIAILFDKAIKAHDNEEKLDKIKGDVTNLCAGFHTPGIII